MSCDQEEVAGEHGMVQEAEGERGWAASCTHAGKRNWIAMKMSGGTPAQHLNPWRQKFQLEQKRERIKGVRKRKRTREKLKLDKQK